MYGILTEGFSFLGDLDSRQLTLLLRLLSNTVDSHWNVLPWSGLFLS
jgi:hypothetical protein